MITDLLSNTTFVVFLFATSMAWLVYELLRYLNRQGNGLRTDHRSRFAFLFLFLLLGLGTIIDIPKLIHDSRIRAEGSIERTQLKQIISRGGVKDPDRPKF